MVKGGKTPSTGTIGFGGEKTELNNKDNKEYNNQNITQPKFSYKNYISYFIGTKQPLQGCSDTI